MKPGFGRSLVSALLVLAAGPTGAEDGYELWLRYPLVSDASLRRAYAERIGAVELEASSPTLESARSELMRGLGGLLGRVAADDTVGGLLVVGTERSSATVAGLDLGDALGSLGEEGYLIRSVPLRGRPGTVIAANTDQGVLYGVFAFLRLLQTHEPIDSLDVRSAPRIRHRVLNHWDNLDGTIERGYAGFSLWDWHKLPDYLSPRYTDYARAAASVGVNGTVVTSVNANATSLTPAWLEKAKALADVFRPWGIRLYLTARFSAPIEIGGLGTADPLSPAVAQWWKDKADEIYRLIPDFGGFCVKANSEGQPGPQDYGRSHAEGANMLADAVAPHGGIVMWRAFVYSNEQPEDRAKQAYSEFVPLDGTFRENVLVQVKNGAIDFQPREPFHPLFGAMPKTPLAMELQITQEYLGQATHLVYLAPMWEEALRADTWARGEGSTVARVVDGTLHGHSSTGIAGVANTGTDRNWCGSVFACANWYAYGRLAWDPGRGSAEIADEWIRMTFSNDEAFVSPVREMMLGSWEAAVDYMTPLGLHHIMARGHHYGPGPWVSGGPRADWTSLYYHRADAEGIGFDRTPTGSNAVEQYFPPVRDLFASLKRCPEKFLLWFHHLPWDHRTSSGRTLWDELVERYSRGVAKVRAMQETWAAQESRVDAERYEQVRAFLAIQEKEARWWRSACLLYFQTFSKRPIPEGYEPLEGTLEEHQALDHRYAPGI